MEVNGLILKRDSGSLRENRNSIAVTKVFVIGNSAILSIENCGINLIF